jgi:adenylate kinase
MINIVLFGAPGAGKGTQAAKLAEKYHFNHISTGDIIRSEIRHRTPLGLEVEDAISHGELAPDHVVLEIVEHFMMSDGVEKNGNIFDGFPRTLHQAEQFDKLLSADNLKIDLMLELVVPEEVLVQRILLRGSESGRADDASERVIRNRIEVYNARTAVVAHYYRAQGKYVAIDGTRSIETNFEALSAEIDKLYIAQTNINP